MSTTPAPRFAEILKARRAARRQATETPAAPAPQTVAKSAAHQSVWIGMPVPPEYRDALTVEGGESPEDLHCTLVMVTDDAATLHEEERARLGQVVQSWANGQMPVSGEISGPGRFTAGDNPVAVALVDAPGLETMRQDLVDRLHRNGFPVKNDHGYTPHVTLAYDDRDDHDPSGPLTFNTVSLGIGGKYSDFLLGGNYDISKASPKRDGDGDGLVDDGLPTQRPATPAEIRAGSATLAQADRAGYSLVHPEKAAARRTKNPLSVLAQQRSKNMFTRAIRNESLGNREDWFDALAHAKGVQHVADLFSRAQNDKALSKHDVAAIAWAAQNRGAEITGQPGRGAMPKTLTSTSKGPDEVPTLTDDIDTKPATAPARKTPEAAPTAADKPAERTPEAPSAPEAEKPDSAAALDSTAESRERYKQWASDVTAAVKAGDVERVTQMYDEAKVNHPEWPRDARERRIEEARQVKAGINDEERTEAFEALRNETAPEGDNAFNSPAYNHYVDRRVEGDDHATALASARGESPAPQSSEAAGTGSVESSLADLEGRDLSTKARELIDAAATPRDLRDIEEALPREKLSTRALNDLLVKINDREDALRSGASAPAPATPPVPSKISLPHENAVDGVSPGFDVDSIEEALNAADTPMKRAAAVRRLIRDAQTATDVEQIDRILPYANLGKVAYGTADRRLAERKREFESTDQPNQPEQVTLDAPDTEVADADLEALLEDPAPLPEFEPTPDVVSPDASDLDPENLRPANPRENKPGGKREAADLARAERDAARNEFWGTNDERPDPTPAETVANLDALTGGRDTSTEAQDAQTPTTADVADVDVISDAEIEALLDEGAFDDANLGAVYEPVEPGDAVPTVDLPDDTWDRDTETFEADEWDEADVASWWQTNGISQTSPEMAEDYVALLNGDDSVLGDILDDLENSRAEYTPRRRRDVDTDAPSLAEHAPKRRRDVATDAPSLADHEPRHRRTPQDPAAGDFAGWAAEANQRAEQSARARAALNPTWDAALNRHRAKRPPATAVGRLVEQWREAMSRQRAARDRRVAEFRARRKAQREQAQARSAEKWQAWRAARRMQAQARGMVARRVDPKGQHGPEDIDLLNAVLKVLADDLVDTRLSLRMRMRRQAQRRAYAAELRRIERDTSRNEKQVSDFDDWLGAYLPGLSEADRVVYLTRAAGMNRHQLAAFKRQLRAAKRRQTDAARDAAAASAGDAADSAA